MVIMSKVPGSKVHGANMDPTWVLSAPDGPHVGPMNLAIRGNSLRKEEKEVEQDDINMKINQFVNG